MKEIVFAVFVDVLVFVATVVVLVFVFAVPVANELVATEVPELDEQAPITIAVTQAFTNRCKKYFLIRFVGHAQVCLVTRQ